MMQQLMLSPGSSLMQMLVAVKTKMPAIDQRAELAKEQEMTRWFRHKPNPALAYLTRDIRNGQLIEKKSQSRT